VNAEVLVLVEEAENEVEDRLKSANMSIVSESLIVSSVT
jgi:hypothetical protein